MSESPTNLTSEQKIDKILTLAVNTSEDVKDIKARLASIEETVRSHSTQLDGIAKDVKTLLEEKTISSARLERLEHWAQQVGEKVGVRLDLGNLPI
jgi:DNA repair ATPase RecN